MSKKLSISIGLLFALGFTANAHAIDSSQSGFWQLASKYKCLASVALCLVSDEKAPQVVSSQNTEDGAYAKNIPAPAETDTGGSGYYGNNAPPPMPVPGDTGGSGYYADRQGPPPTPAAAPAPTDTGGSGGEAAPSKVTL